MTDPNIWTDLATWVGPTVNEGGTMHVPFGLILHIQEGSQAGSIAWCKNPASKVSAHFFAAKSGALAQLVPVNRVAWAEVDGNDTWISLECEGYSGDKLTPGQVLAAAALLAKIHRIYGVPLQISNDPYLVPGLTGHGLGGAGYGGHTDCPGAPILAQRGSIISNAAIIVAEQETGPVALTPGDLDAIKLAVWGYRNPTLDDHDMRQVIKNAEASSAAAARDAAAALAAVKALTPPPAAG